VTGGGCEALHAMLSSLPAGPLPADMREPVLDQLRACWDRLDGSDAEAMEARKLGRVEDLEWHAPALTFRMERHGAILAGGSTYADVQQWTIDLARGVAECEPVGRRQVRKPDARLDVRPLADDVARHMVSGLDHPAIQWLPDRRRVRVLTGRVVPPKGFKQTVEGRRQRFNRALREALPDGWTRGSGGWWAAPAAEPNTGSLTPTTGNEGTT
jgi:hypothetical protein